MTSPLPVSDCENETADEVQKESTLKRDLGSLWRRACSSVCNASVMIYVMSHTTISSDDDDSKGGTHLDCDTLAGV